MFKLTNPTRYFYLADNLSRDIAHCIENDEAILLSINGWPDEATQDATTRTGILVDVWQSIIYVSTTRKIEYRKINGWIIKIELDNMGMQSPVWKTIFQVFEYVDEMMPFVL
jgi:hypothetical protein